MAGVSRVLCQSVRQATQHFSRQPAARHLAAGASRTAAATHLPPHASARSFATSSKPLMTLVVNGGKQRLVSPGSILVPLQDLDKVTTLPSQVVRRDPDGVRICPFLGSDELENAYMKKGGPVPPGYTAKATEVLVGQNASQMAENGYMEISAHLVKEALVMGMRPMEGSLLGNPVYVRTATDNAHNVNSDFGKDPSITLPLESDGDTLAPGARTLGFLKGNTVFVVGTPPRFFRHAATQAGYKIEAAPPQQSLLLDLLLSMGNCDAVMCDNNRPLLRPVIGISFPHSQQGVIRFRPGNRLDTLVAGANTGWTPIATAPTLPPTLDFSLT